MSTKLTPGVIVQIRTIPPQQPQEVAGFLKGSVEQNKGFTLQTFNGTIRYPVVVETKENNEKNFFIKFTGGNTLSVHILHPGIK